MKYLYLVSYDLNKIGQNYALLYGELKKTGTYNHILDSTWLVSSDEDVKTFTQRLYINGKLDGNDHVLVFDITNSLWWGYLNKADIDWVSKYL
ncbi:MAG: hypothetical protein WC472_01680 [Candidatus Paceibacterota bacterium]